MTIPFAGINWLEPRDLDTTKMAFYINAHTRTPQGDICDDISSCHPAGANVLFGDGSVRTLAFASPDPKELEAMIIINGDKAVPVGH